MASNFNMNWDEIPSSNDGNGLEYLVLKPGINQIRIAGQPSKLEIHWENDLNGGKKKIICLGAKCPICKKGVGHEPQIKFQVKVIDRAENKIKVLECGKQIIKSIKEYAMDSDYGDPTKYDIKIKKEGSGRDTKYSVMPVPNKSNFTEEELKMIEESPDIADINKIKTEEEIYQMQLAVLADSIADLVEDDDMNDGTDDPDWDDL